MPNVNPTILIDHYPKVDGQPVIAIFKKPTLDFKFEIPEYLETVREISDEPQYTRKVMSKRNYYLDRNDKVNQSYEEEL